MPDTPPPDGPPDIGPPDIGQPDTAARAGKSSLRASLRAARREAHAAFTALPAVTRQRITGDMATRLLAHLPAAPTIIASYRAVASELDPAPIEAVLRDHGHSIALPRITRPDQALAFHRLDDPARLIPGPHDIAEPDPSLPVIRPAVLLVPLVGADTAGHRLGQGGGYYDRTLASLRATGPVLALGLAYDAQITPIPAEPHDQPLDAVLTPTCWIGCRPDTARPDNEDNTLDR